MGVLRLVCGFGVCCLILGTELTEESGLGILFWFSSVGTLHLYSEGVHGRVWVHWLG